MSLSWIRWRPWTGIWVYFSNVRCGYTGYCGCCLFLSLLPIGQWILYTFGNARSHMEFDINPDHLVVNGIFLYSQVYWLLCARLMGCDWSILPWQLIWFCIAGLRQECAVLNMERDYLTVTAIVLITSVQCYFITPGGHYFNKIYTIDKILPLTSSNGVCMERSGTLW